MAISLDRIRRRRIAHQPGAAPGSLLPAAEALPTEVRMTRYDARTLEERTGMAVDDLPLASHEAVLWVDVVGLGDVTMLQALGNRFGLHPLALEDIVNVNHRPKLESFDADLFLIVRMFSPIDQAGTFASEQLSLLLRPGLVMTFQERHGDCFEQVRQRLQSAPRRIRRSGADYLAYALLDAVIDAYQPVLDGYEEQIEDIEDRLLVAADDSDLRHLHSYRRDLISLRRSIAPVRDVVNDLIRKPELTETVNEETRLFLRDCYDHVIRTVDQIDNFRELCASLMDLYMSTVSNRTNDVMKVLTMIATIFIPLSFLVGLYGMNFDTSSPYNMPELSSRFGYPVLLGLMLAVAVALLAYFKKKGWL